jgi:hypothetical protein
MDAPDSGGGHHQVPGGLEDPAVPQRLPERDVEIPSGCPTFASGVMTPSSESCQVRQHSGQGLAELGGRLHVVDARSHRLEQTGQLVA